MKAFPELTAALREMADRMDASLRASGFAGPALRMFVAGGIAVNYHCGTRYTEDVDASFSQRFVLPRELTINYRRADGTAAFIYFDHNYNTSFALLHEDFEENTLEWPGIGNEGRFVQLRVLAPLDLAVSKLARFSEQDREDIVALAREKHFSAGQLRRHVAEALQNYIGDKRPLSISLDLVCAEIGHDG